MERTNPSTVDSPPPTSRLTSHVTGPQQACPHTARNYHPSRYGAPHCLRVFDFTEKKHRLLPGCGVAQQIPFTVFHLAPDLHTAETQGTDFDTAASKSSSKHTRSPEHPYRWRSCCALGHAPSNAPLR